MATKTGGTLVYEIQAGSKPDTLNVKQVGSSAGISSAYANLATTVVKGQNYLVGYNPAANHLDFYQFTTSAPWLKAAKSANKIQTGLSIIDPFVIGNKPAVVGYEPKKGILWVYELADDLSLSKTPYEFFRNHEPSLTQGFATLKSFTAFGQVVFMGYNADNGYVAMYTVQVTATSPAGTPPLLFMPAWAHNWAKGWTRFAFFQLGGENFFLKTNIVKPNVNIDHVMDGLSTGTAEVGTNLVLKDAQQLTLVEAFYLGNGEPYFVTYKPNGEVTLYRFHTDCLGWTQVASLTSKSNATHLVPLASGGKQYLLIV